MRTATKGSAFGIRKPLKRLDLNFDKLKFYFILLAMCINLIGASAAFGSHPRASRLVASDAEPYSGSERSILTKDEVSD